MYSFKVDSGSQNEEFVTLAHTKSPKTSKRTTFQDELEAALSARSRRTQMEQYTYSDDFSDSEDDFLNGLLKSRKEKAGATGRSKTKINDFGISDDESKHGRTKRVSFLKTKRIISPSEDTSPSDSCEQKLPDSSVRRTYDCDNSLSPQQSIHEHETQFRNGDGDSTDHRNARESTGKPLLHRMFEETLLDTPLLSDKMVTQPSGTEERSSSGLEETSQTPQLPAADLSRLPSADSAAGKELPRPKPRQRTLRLSLQTKEKMAEDAESQDVSRPHTSSTSIPFSSDTASSSAWTEGDCMVSGGLSKALSSKSEESQLLTRTTVDSASGDGFISDNSKDQGSKGSTSLEEFNQDSRDHAYQVSNVNEKSVDTRKSSSHLKTSQRSQSLCPKNVESKYLGSLKVLDCNVSLQDSQPLAADSLRAAIYQVWLQNKKQKSRQNKQLKKEEEMLKEKKKREKESAKEDAVASYEAWKERKAESLKVKAKEKQDEIRKQQKEMEEKEEKRQSAKKVFEKWKHEHDHTRKEKHRKQKEAESKLQLKKQETEEERKHNSKSAYSNWCGKKRNFLHEKVKMEREAVKIQVEEEQYLKEERDKMALEMYESWLKRKDLQEKRQQEERRIQEILRDSPPPPWSPPNKTVPFRR